MGFPRVWDALFEGLEAGEPGLLAGWREGLGLNRAAPEDVLIAVLHREASLLWRRDLPPSVVDAALEQGLYGTWAENRDLTPAQWQRLISREQDPRRRARLIHLMPRVELDRAMPLADSDETVRDEAGRAELKDQPLTQEVWELGGGSSHMLTHRPLVPDLAVTLASDTRPEIRRALAANPGLPASVVVRLADDPDPAVRLAIACRPELTDEQRDSIAIDVDPDWHWTEPEWIAALHADPDAMRRLASSKVFLIRRAVARAKHLPPDVIERLANDPDRVVQLFLAESCDDAPAEMLLRVAEWWTGSLSAPDVPRRHPNFPKLGLLRFADDPNPNLRRLALDDPRSTPELVERLVDDPDEMVRHRAESDPRISVETAERLLGEPGRRGTVAANPGLPPRLLITLLRDEHTAYDGARNPSLPPDVMREMARRLVV